MRITRSLSFKLQLASKKSLFITATSFFTLASLLISNAALQPAHQASAAATPESCFAFDSATSTITNYYDNQNNDTAQPACPRDVEIPSSIGGVAVTTIGENDWVSNTSFSGKRLTSVVIPSSVTGIGYSAFSSNQLATLTIPGSVNTIGASAFYSNQLTDLIILSSVTDIGSEAFSRNLLSSLPSYFSNPTVTDIPADIFSYNKFTSLSVPSNITTVADSAFAYNLLASITVSGSTTTVSDYAFSSNPVTSFTVDGTQYISVASTPAECFDFDAASNTIMVYHFSTIASLRNGGAICLAQVVIPSSISGAAVTAIGRNSFYGDALTALTIPSSVTNIEGGAFTYNRLTTLTIPSSVKSIGGDAFAWGNISSLVLSEGLETIGLGAFMGNNLRSVSVPDSLQSLTDYARCNPVNSDAINITCSIFGQQGMAIEQFSQEIHFAGGYLTVHADSLADPRTKPIIQNAINSTWLISVYTKPTNTRNFQDFVDIGTIRDQSGDQPVTTGHFLLGGHLINPSSLTLNYVNSQNTELRQQITITGQTKDGVYLNDYSGLAGIADAFPYPADPRNLTPAEQQAIQDVFKMYYRIGQSVAITPPEIAGYIAPQAQNFVLSAATNDGALIYLTSAEASTKSNNGQLAATGEKLYLLAGAGVAIFVVGLVIVILVLRRKK